MIKETTDVVAARPPVGMKKQTANARKKAAETLNNQELLALFRKEAQASRRALVRSGALISAEELAQALGISLSELGAEVRAGRLFTLEVDGQLYHPSFYKAKSLNRDALARVTQALAGVPGWVQWVFFTTPKHSLYALTPLRALKINGMLQSVLGVACGVAESFGGARCVATTRRLSPDGGAAGAQAR